MITSPSWMSSLTDRLWGGYRYTAVKGNLEKKQTWSIGRSRIAAICALALIAIFSISLATRSGSTQGFKDAFNKATSHSDTSSSDRTGHFHILIPADKSDQNLCKAIISATITGFGVPTLYNWHGSSSKMAKITGALDYFKALDSTHDKDLALIVDGFDLWFQLSPQVMIDRYQEINKRAEERIRGRMGDVMKHENVSQTIVFSSQKRCWPGKDDDASCYAVPESTLPKYIYGPQTDTLTGDEKNNYLRIRQRWLNAGVAIGPIKEMRTLFERAQERAEANPDVQGHDQAVLADIWGEQEYSREAARSRETGPWKREEGKPEIKADPPRKAFEPKIWENYEFGIGLDYESSLSMPTVFSELDSDWLTFNNEETLDTAFKKYKISTPRAKELQSDIAKSKAPFSLLGPQSKKAGDQEDWRLPSKSLGWNAVPIYTNLWTGISPVIIHHNAHRDGLKALRESTWDKMWFQPQARALLDARVAEPQSPIAIDAAGKKWYPAVDKAIIERKGFGAQTDNKEMGRWEQWKDLCPEKAQEEVFRDGKGPWVAKEFVGEESKPKGGGSRR